MVKYSTISIPKELHEEIKHTFIDNPRFGYASVAEFSMEAIKIRLAEIRKALEEEQSDRREKMRKTVESIKRKIK
jgi:hypothetical protein